MSNSRHIVVVAGEASGDAHAGRMVAALRQHYPDIQVSGIGGDNMREAGADIFIDFSELAVMGLVEVIKRYPTIKGIFNRLVAKLQQNPPDLLVLVDYPGFNLKLAKKAHQLGIPVAYYISPKVWAWRPGRIKTIKKYVDHMLVLFPFEQQLYEAEGIPVTCVGHPLVESVSCSFSAEACQQKFNLPADKPVVGLFPGSRKSEVSNLLPVMLQAAEQMAAKRDLTFVVPLAPGLQRDYLQTFLDNSSVTVEIVSGDFYQLTKACDAIVAASGTVTLEIALIGTPHFIIYRVAPLSYKILKRLVKIPYVGLCNIVTAENIISELLQDEVTADNLEQRLMTFLTDPQAKQDAELIRQQVLQALGPAGGADNAAQTIARLVQ